MTIRAFRRGLLINHHEALPNRARLRVTFIASHICMAALQRKMRSSIVIEGRRHPALRLMAIRAWSLPGLCKLAGVNVLVAVFANLGGAFELHLFGSHRDLVTRAAFHRAVRTQQGKFCLGMVEPDDVRPGTRVMAGFTTERCATGAPLRHPILEFPVMRIRVASGAGHILETERKNLVGSPGSPCLMTISASHRGVGSAQWETGVAMFCDRVRRAVKIQNRVAILASIPERSAGELIIVGVLVAVEARCKFHLV